jgi:hypothetical protein
VNKARLQWRRAFGGCAGGMRRAAFAAIITCTPKVRTEKEWTVPNRVLVIGAVLVIVVLLLIEVLVFGLGWGQ